MDIVVDGSPISSIPPGTKTYRDLLKAVQSSNGSPSRAILSVSLNGQVISHLALEARYDEVLPGDGRMDIVTADSFRLAIDTLAGLISHVGTLDRVHQRAAEQIIAAKYRDAMESFDECFQGWALLTRALQSVSSLVGLEWKSLETATGPAEPKIQKIHEALIRFKTAFDLQDVVRVGDVLQYDLIPLLEESRSILVALKRRLESQSTPLS